MEIEKIIYEERNGVVKTKFQKEYIGTKGIWALYGKNNENSDYVCLNVGKGKDVGLEIIYDLGCFHYISFSKDGTRRYINQFGEDCGFCYQSGQTQEYLYPYLASKYTCIKFIYVHEENDLQKEKGYADQQHALFWRNGGAYKSAKKTKNK